MKKITQLFFICITLLSSAWLSGQTTLLSESFETDGNGSRYSTSIPEFSDGASDFFTRTDGSGISTAYAVTGADGNFYFAAQDIDGEGSAATQTLSFTGINIASFENLGFSILLAEDDASDGSEDWDIIDFMTIEYQIDGGGFSNLLAVESIPDGDDFNAVPAIDTDFDGDGDGTIITSTFAAFGNAISGTGSSLDIRITINLNAGDEDIAIDLIEVTGDSEAMATPLISEFQPNPIGTDPNPGTLELSGQAGEPFTGVLVALESDPGGSNPGDVNGFEAISGTFDINGLLTVSIADLENPSFTLVLLSEFTGDETTDIDTDDDGVADDISTFGTVYDAIGVPDVVGDETFLYASELGGTDFAFTGDEPRLIFRDASVGDLYAVNDPDNGQVFNTSGIDVTPAIFNIDPTSGTDTFGTINPEVGGVVSNTLGITATDAVKPEGNSGTTDFIFTVSRTGDTSGVTAVDYLVSSSEADVLDFGGAFPNGTVNFAADETSQVVTISVVGDTDTETDEIFSVALSNPANLETLSPSTAEGTIQNDDTSSATSLVINEIHADPAADLSGDANGDGVRDATQDEFVELVNTGTEALDISGWTVSDAVGVRHTFPANTILNPEQAIVVFGGNTPTGSFGGAVVQTASSGALGLNNGGDTVTVNNGTEDVATETYGSEGGSDQSLTRDPDVTGGFVQHTTATNAGGALFSPGTLVDGTPFPGNDVPLPNVVFNELRISTGGSSDNVSNYVELFGDVNASLNGLSIVVLSGEFEPGQVDFAFDISTGATDSEGFFLLANADIATAISQAQLDPTDVIDSFDFFGSPSTFLLVQDFSATQGDDLDADNDGVLDNSIGDIIASISLVDGDGTPDISYSSTVLGPDGNFAPAGAARTVADGTGDFVTLDFGDVSVDTPGFSNIPDIIDPGEITLIHDIQGTSDLNAMDNMVVTVEAVVVGDFQDGDADTSRDLRGFYLQEEDTDADANPLTSEGIFIFEGNGATANDINVGDLVQVTGTVDEFFNETQLDQITNIEVISSGNTLPTPASISLPSVGTIVDQAGDIAPDLEAFEGMLVNFPQTLTITEMFQLDRFNEIKLSQGGRLAQFTQNNIPDVAGYTAHLQSNGARTITYDDGLSLQNTSIANLDGFGPNFSTDTDIRMGDTIENLSGILSYQWAGNSSSQATWRVRATQNGENTFAKVDARPTVPEEVGGSLKVASLNVLNYFTTLDDETPRNGTPLTAIGQEPRGANDLTAVGVNPATAEFDRQTTKLVNALVNMDADIVGLVEIENDFLTGSSGNAIENLVNELNAVLGAGTYAWVDPGIQFVGDDVIAVGMIYKTASVSIAEGTNIGVLTDADLAGLGLAGLPAVFNGNSTNRSPLAVTFEELSTGGIFTAVVNHLKSKGSPGTSPTGDNDINDGVGNGNQTRLNGATALNAWLNTDPTGSGDSDFIILGDLNAYAEEAPITFLEGEGYVDLAQLLVGPSAASFVFDGQTGTLDYALANMTLLSQVTGATEWAINSSEPDAIDYNLDFGRDASIFDGTVPFRTSDHDPIIVGLDLTPTDMMPPVITLVGDNPLILVQGDTYEDPGATAEDDKDGVIDPSNIVVGGEVVDTETVGTYLVTYNVSDSAGNPAEEVVRTVVVEAPTLTVTKFVLVDARTNQDIMEITEGMIIDLNALPSKILSVRAETTEDVESVGFLLTGGKYRRGLDNSAPYSLFGDFYGNYWGRRFAEGDYHLQAVPFSRNWLRGERGTQLGVNFTFVKEEVPAGDLESIRIYPNPAVFYTKIGFDGPVEVERVKLFNRFGRLVRTYDGNRIKVGDEYVLNVSFLWSGVYFVVVEDVNGNSVQRRLIVR